jgi:hypothetical protein
MASLTNMLKLPAQDRDRMEVMQILHEEGASAAHKRNLDMLQSHLTVGAMFGSSVYFPSVISQARNFPLLIRGGMTPRQILFYYGQNLSPIPTFSGIVLSGLYQSLKKSRSQDEKSRPSGRPVKPKTLRGNSKLSRPGSPGSTSKPFWSKGKPKCKKGFRYDFKRKLCVKIK